jgi:hypothetical protein
MLSLKRTVWGSIPVGRDLSSPFRSALRPTQAPIQWVPCLFPGGKATRGLALSTHSCLAPKLKKSRAIPVLSFWASTARARVNLTLLHNKRMATLFRIHRGTRKVINLFYSYDNFISYETMTKIITCTIKSSRPRGRNKNSNQWFEPTKSTPSLTTLLLLLMRLLYNKVSLLIHVFSVTFGFMSRKCSKVKLTGNSLVVPDPNFLSLMHIHVLYKRFYIGAKVLPSSCARNTRVHRGSV